jgi:hypothetical protein
METGWICDQAVEPNGQLAVCRPTEVACDDPRDCPRYKPSSTGEWSCEDHVCRFPGFEYVHPNPEPTSE